MPTPAEVVLPNDRQVRVTRTFNAPRQLVWEVHTTPELVQEWQPGYDGWDMPICEMDVRVDGTYRWHWKNREDGKQFGFFGSYTDVNVPSKLVYQEYFDPGDVGGPGDIGGDMPVGDPCIVSLEFSEQDGVTTLVCTMTYVSKDARDGAVSTGMTEGMEFSYARLDEMLARRHLNLGKADVMGSSSGVVPDRRADSEFSRG